MRHCETCTCESRAEAIKRREREDAEREAKEREVEFARRHSTLRAEDVAWARRLLEEQKR